MRHFDNSIKNVTWKLWDWWKLQRKEFWRDTKLVTTYLNLLIWRKQPFKGLWNMWQLIFFASCLIQVSPFFSLVGIFLLSVLYHFYSSCFKFGAPVIPRQSKQVKQVLKNSACAGPGLVSSLKIMCIFLSSVVFYLEKISFNLKLFKFSYSCMNGPPRKFPYSSYFVL